LPINRSYKPFVCFILDKDDSSLERIIKCAEMILTVSEKIVSLSGGCPYRDDTSMDSQMETSVSILTNSQLEQLDVACHDIQLALSSLERLVQDPGSIETHCSTSLDFDCGAGEGCPSTGGIVKRNLAIFEH